MGAPIVGCDANVGAFINGGCTNTHAVIKKPLDAVALIGTNWETPVLFVPLTMTLPPVDWLRETRGEEVDHVMVFGARAGKTVALIVAVVWLVMIDGDPLEIPIP